MLITFVYAHVSVISLVAILTFHDSKFLNCPSSSFPTVQHFENKKAIPVKGSTKLDKVLRTLGGLM